MRTFFFNYKLWVSIIGIAAISLGVAYRLEQLEATKIEIPEVKPPITVMIKPVIRSDIVDWIVGEGVARASQKKFLNFERGGKVVFINKDLSGQPLHEGSRVRGPFNGEKLGQLLARIDDREQAQELLLHEAALAEARENYAAIQEEYHQIQNTLKLSENQINRIKKLAATGLIAKVEFEKTQNNYLNTQSALKAVIAKTKSAKIQIEKAVIQINLAKLQLEKSSIFAPFGGTIAYLNIKPGEIIQTSAIDLTSESTKLKTAAIVIISDNQYEITLKMPVFDGKYVRRGQSAYIRWGESVTPQWDQEKAKQGELVVKGKVYSASPSISPGDRTLQVKIRTSTAKNRLKDGLPVICWIAINEHDAALVIPTESLIIRNNKRYVYRLDPPTSKVKLVEIKTGIEDSKILEILEGVSEHDQIVTIGKLKINNGEVVRIIKPKEENL